MKIVHFGKYYSPDRGGIESVTESLAEFAQGVGYEVEAICFDKTGNLAGISILNGVTVNRISITKMLNAQPLSFTYLLECIRKGRQAEIVHLHFPNLLAAIAALMIGKDTKLIVHWHSDIIGKGLMGKIVAPLERLLLKRANVVLATSPTYVDGSTRLKSVTEKVKVVPLGVNDIEKNQVKRAVPERLSVVLRNRPFILSVGRLTAYKAYSVLIEAARFLSDNIAIVIAGDGELREELASQIAQLNLQDRVILAGRVTDEELISLYQNASMFCLPSNIKSEAFGVVLMEAMTYSLPIVAAEIPGSGVPWVNQNGVSGLNVPVNDSLALSEAIAKIMGDKTLMDKFSKGARARYDEYFTSRKSCEATIAIYRDSLEH